MFLNRDAINGCCLCCPGAIHLSRFFHGPGRNGFESGCRFQTGALPAISRSAFFQQVPSLPLYFAFLLSLVLFLDSRKNYAVSGVVQPLSVRFYWLRWRGENLFQQLSHIFQVKLLAVFTFAAGGNTAANQSHPGLRRAVYQ